MFSLWLHGILARIIHSTRCWLHSERALRTRVIDFVNVTGAKIFLLLRSRCKLRFDRISCAGTAAPRTRSCGLPPLFWSRSGAEAPQAKFASKGGRPVYFWFALSNFLPVRSAVSNAEAHIPTQPSSPFQDARVSFSHEDQERTGGHFPPSRQGAQARRREAGLPRIIA
jgi:hypothetical protein